MPKVALGDDDPVLLSSWTVAEGEEFAEGDVLFEVETDKAMMEVEATEPGVLAAQVIEAGARVAPGEVVAVLAARGETVTAADVEARRATLGSGAPAATAAVPDVGAAAAPAPIPVPDSLPIPRPSPVPAAVPAAEPVAAVVPAFTSAGALYGLPARRRIGPPARNGAPAAPTRQPLSRHRAALARLMTASAAIPQFSVHRELPMHETTRLVALLRRGGTPATVTDVLLRATALALSRHRELNGWFTADAVEHVAEPAIGLATDGPAGVVAPVVRGADRLGWAQLAEERRRIVDGARRGRLLPADLAGGTFSISNVGALGGDLVVPLLTPPQLAVLGVGRIRQGWGGTVASAALVADHRALDGADAARFLGTLVEILGDGELLGGRDG